MKYGIPLSLISWKIVLNSSNLIICICEKKLKMDWMIPSARGKRRILNVVTYMWNLKEKKVDYTETESRKESQPGECTW